VSACQVTAKDLGLDNLTFTLGSFQMLSADPGYDLIISIDVLEHVQDDEGMLARMSAVLRPGGMVVIHVPLRHQDQKRIFKAFRQHTVSDHVRDEYLPEEIRQKVEQAGLTIEKLEFGFGFLGELSFELNNLFWEKRFIRNVLALLFLPISLVTGYIDTRRALKQGNSIVLVARKHSAQSKNDAE
jgi:SAM-dependent methyltransferase